MVNIRKIGSYLGWAGAVVAIGAYFLLATDVLSVTDWEYWFLNLVGPFLLGTDVALKKAWGPFGLQVTWGIISIYKLIALALN